MIKKRVAASALSLSAAAFVARMEVEGYTDTPVIPVKGDRLTIGFGTANNVNPWDRTTPVKALQRALKDTQHFEMNLKKCVTAPLYQEEYDLYVNLMYNIGPTAYCSSTIVKRLNAHNYSGACDAILMWKYAGGYDCSTPGNKRCAGLWTDRLETHRQCKAAL